MTNKHQEIKNELQKEFFKLLNLVRGKIQKDDPNLKRFEEIIQQEKINPSQIPVTFQYSAISWIAMDSSKQAFNMLLKYADESKKPEDLRSIWYGLGQSANQDMMKMMVKKKIFDHINTPFNGLTPLSCIKNQIFNQFRKGKYPDSLTPEKVFSPALKILLSSGADINTFCSSPDMHFVSVLLDPYKESKKSYQTQILKDAFSFGFDANLLFDKETGNNFIQHLLNNEADLFLYFNEQLKLVLDNTKIDYSYKNKKGETILDIVNREELSKVKHYFEKGFLSNSLNLKDDTESHQMKKRL